MKYAVVLVLACLGVCFAAVDKDGVEVWGIETQDVLGSKRIEVDSSWFEVKVREFTFPEVSKPHFHTKFKKFGENNIFQEKTV